MKTHRLNWRILLWLIIFCLSAPLVAQEFMPLASFRNFDQRARAGHTLVVVFFGGSTTWGEGASDPELTSFRALLRHYLKEKYPRAHFVFHDAAIADTGSKLGMFRVQRDVIEHHPDLVFIDFTVEDKLEGNDRETLGSYERILRDLIYEGIPVGQVIIGTKENFGPGWTHLCPARYRDHLEMGKLYHAAIGNSFAPMRTYLRSEKHDRDQIWPKDDLHPGDIGHELIFEAMRDGLEEAIRKKEVSSMPFEPVFAGAYSNRFQFFPASQPLPNGWRVADSLRPKLEPSQLSDAWKSQVALCDVSARDTAKPLQINFNGTFLGILGEADEHGLGFKVSIDGHPAFYKKETHNEVWPTTTNPSGGGERFFWHEISAELTPGRHNVEILPVFPDGIEKGALRIESVCVAGPGSQDIETLAANGSR